MSTKDTPNISKVVRELETSVAVYAKKNSELQEKVAELQSEISRLRAEIEQRSIKEQARLLYRSIDRAIEQRIHQRAVKAMSTRGRPSLPIPDSIGGRVELQRELRKYDASMYYTYKAAASDIPLQYRLLSRVYRTGRDASAVVLKSSIRLAGKVKK